MICGEQTVSNRNNDEGEYSVLRCKCWSCESCQPINAWNVIKAACRGLPSTFMTLTCNPALYATPDQAARSMMQGLRALRKALAREKGIPRLPMIAVFEKTKAGWPHLHILCRAPWIDQEWLSTTWQRLTGAKIVDIRSVDDPGRAAHYVAKYISKALVAFHGTKRWWRSHDYEIESTDTKTKVRYGARLEIIDRPYADIRADLERLGARIVEEKPGWCHFQIDRQWSG